jgi:hypothetical protein
MKNLLKNKIFVWITLFILCIGYMLCFSYPVIMLLFKIDGCTFDKPMYEIIPLIILFGAILFYYFNKYIDYLIKQNIL